MKTIFKKNDFRLCKLPVPPGYLYAQTHVGVGYSCSGIGGCHWFLVSSPYPNPKRKTIIRALRFVARHLFNIKTKSSDWYENPMFYYSDSVEKTPTEFTAFPSNPLMDTPEDLYGCGAFNSDPDIYVEGDNIYVLNRPTWRKHSKEGNVVLYSKLYLIKIQYNGNIFTSSKPINLFDYPNANCSPSLTFFEGKFRIFSLLSNSYNTGEPCESVEMRSCIKIDGNYDDSQLICVETKDYQPWHFSVFHYQTRLYSIVACTKGREPQRCYQMLGEFSDDLKRIHIYQMPLTDMKSYRGAAVVLPNGNFILYSSIIEPFKDSVSVDGRDIVVAESNFDIVLKTLKEYDKKNFGE